MDRRFSPPLLALLGCCACSDGVPPTPDEPWIPLYEGVAFRREEKPKAWDRTDARIQQVTALRVDLTADVRFVTAGQGKLPAHPGQEFVSTTGRTLAESMSVHPSVSVAINGGFFWPCCSQDGAPPTAMSLFGLNVADGVAVSSYDSPRHLQSGKWTTEVPGSSWVGAVALVITKDHRAEIVWANESSPVPVKLSDIEVAVSGGPAPATDRCPMPGECDAGWPPQLPILSPQGNAYPAFLLKHGRTELLQDDNVSARSAVGVGDGGRYLYLLTVDGEDGAIPVRGASYYDMARWLESLGAETAISLSDGGSVTLSMGTNGQVPSHLVCPEIGRSVALNVPRGDGATPCLQRLLGSFLGVSANPL